jgi:hypothetical protein
MPLVDKEERKEYNRQRYLLNKDKNKCGHGRRKDQCKECGGSGICEHGRQKSKCKDCGGSQICEHGRDKYQCKECGGSQICEHGRVKAQCKECGGSQICEHGRVKSKCKDCGGSGICEHGRIKSVCKECGGSQICEHGRRKDQCKECDIYSYLVILQRNRIARIMKQTNLTKTKPSIEYLDCSPEFFKEFIKSKMTEGMTFDNIQYDHIKPVSKFNLEDPDELMKCCHYTNFQPLMGYDNQIKSNKWDDEDELFWYENIIYKDYSLIYLPKM